MLGAMNTGTLKKAQLTWIIRDIFKLPEKVGNFSPSFNAEQEEVKRPVERRERFDSPRFHAEKEEGVVDWMLQIKKKSCHEENKESPLGLFLRLYECPVIDPNVTARFSSISIFDETEETLLFEKKSDFNRPLSFSKDLDFYWGDDNNVLSEHLLIGDLEKIVKIPQGLLIRFNIEYEKGILEDSTPTEILFSSKSGSDVCFIIAGQEIKAHKSILSAKNPVFTAMFQPGMKEEITDRIDIPAGISPDIFNELLRFIYTDRVHLTKSNAEPLLAASNQYSILLLQYKCEKYFIKQVSIENCIEMLTLGLLHNTRYLKERTLFKMNLFGIGESRKFRETDAWETFKLAYPRIACDILEDLLNDAEFEYYPVLLSDFSLLKSV